MERQRSVNMLRHWNITQDVYVVLRDNANNLALFSPNLWTGLEMAVNNSKEKNLLYKGSMR